MSVALDPTQCLYCARFRSPLGEPRGYPERTCDAYPGGIPDAIWDGSADHRGPFTGDHGLQWIPAEGVSEYPVLAK